jgi:hypothetical protein
MEDVAGKDRQKTITGIPRTVVQKASTMRDTIAPAGE